MSTYEYEIIRSPAGQTFVQALQQRMNDLGSQGFRLVAFNTTSGAIDMPEGSADPILHVAVMERVTE